MGSGQSSSQSKKAPGPESKKAPGDEDFGKTEFTFAPGTWAPDTWFVDDTPNTGRSNPKVKTCGDTGKSLSWCQRIFDNDDKEKESIGNFRDKCKPFCKSIGYPVIQNGKFEDGTLWTDGKAAKAETTFSAGTDRWQNLLCKKATASICSMGRDGSTTGDFVSKCAPWCEMKFGIWGGELASTAAAS